MHHCQNATSLARVRLAGVTQLNGVFENSQISSSVRIFQITLDCTDEYFGLDEQRYPGGADPNLALLSADTRVMGFKMLARKTRENPTDDLERTLTFLAYRKLEPTNRVEITYIFPVDISDDNEPTKLKLPPDSVEHDGLPLNEGFRAGSIVFSEFGTFATIVRIEDEIVTLSEDLFPTGVSRIGIQIIVEVDEVGQFVQSRSPIMAMTQTNITLKKP